MNKSTKILIIEDNESLLLLMNHYFRKHYDVYATKNGLDAMCSLNNGILPDLILLDWNMPVMNGKKFLEGIKNSGFFKNIPVIIISGSEEVGAKVSARMDIDYYFPKPFDPKELNRLIQQTLSSEYN